MRLLGVAVTGANCFLEPGVRVTRKILDVAGLEEILVSLKRLLVCCRIPTLN